MCASCSVHVACMHLGATSTSVGLVGAEQTRMEARFGRFGKSGDRGQASKVFSEDIGLMKIVFGIHRPQTF